jgi:hypothetical protein
MEDAATAARVLGHYEETPCVVRGKAVHIQYSDHPRLVIKPDSGKVS